MNSGLRCRETAVKRPTRRVKELVLIREQAGRCSSFDIGTSARSFTREAKAQSYRGLGGEGKVHIDIVSQELQTQTGVGIEWNGERQGSSRVIVPTKRDPQRSALNDVGKYYRNVFLRIWNTTRSRLKRHTWTCPRKNGRATRNPGT